MRTIKLVLSILLISSFSLTSIGCSRSAKSNGMDEQALQSILKDMEEEPILAMVVIKDGHKVASYQKQGEADPLYDLHSVTKSFTSALIGIAIDQGILRGTDQPISDFFPELLDPDEDPRKRLITVGDLMSMESGIDWPEWTDEWQYYVAPMLESPDWTRFVLERPMAEEPGRLFNYNSGGWQVLATILKKRTGLSEKEFADKYLFGKLDIRRAEWDESPDGTNAAGLGLHLSIDDAAKLGSLYLQGGKWNGEQVISADWIEKSTERQADGDANIGGYGYGWWLQSYDGNPTYFALGYAGQYVFVVPNRNMVVAFTSDSPQDAGLPVRYLQRLLQASLA